MRKIKDINELFLNNIEHFYNLSFLGKSFSYYFSDKVPYVHEDELHINCNDDYNNIRVFITLSLNNDLNRYDDLYDKIDCLSINICCNLSLDKKEKFIISFRDILTEATEEDYINYLINTNRLMIESEMMGIEGLLQSKNRKIKEIESNLKKEKDKLKHIEKLYPTYLL